MRTLAHVPADVLEAVFEFADAPCTLLRSRAVSTRWCAAVAATLRYLNGRTGRTLVFGRGPVVERVCLTDAAVWGRLCVVAFAEELERVEFPKSHFYEPSGLESEASWELLHEREESWHASQSQLRARIEASGGAAARIDALRFTAFPRLQGITCTDEVHNGPLDLVCTMARQSGCLRELRLSEPADAFSVGLALPTADGDTSGPAGRTVVASFSGSGIEVLHTPGALGPWVCGALAHFPRLRELRWGFRWQDIDCAKTGFSDFCAALTRFRMDAHALTTLDLTDVALDGDGGLAPRQLYQLVRALPASLTDLSVSIPAAIPEFTNAVPADRIAFDGDTGGDASVLPLPALRQLSVDVVVTRSHRAPTTDLPAAAPWSVLRAVVARMPALEDLGLRCVNSPAPFPPANLGVCSATVRRLTVDCRTFNWPQVTRRQDATQPTPPATPCVFPLLETLALPSAFLQEETPDGAAPLMPLVTSIGVVGSGAAWGEDDALKPQGSMAALKSATRMEALRVYEAALWREPHIATLEPCLAHLVSVDFRVPEHPIAMGPLLRLAPVLRSLTLRGHNAAFADHLASELTDADVADAAQAHRCMSVFAVYAVLEAADRLRRDLLSLVLAAFSRTLQEVGLYVHAVNATTPFEAPNPWPAGVRLRCKYETVAPTHRARLLKSGAVDLDEWLP